MNAELHGRSARIWLNQFEAKKIEAISVLSASRNVSTLENITATVPLQVPRLIPGEDADDIAMVFI